MVAVEPRATVSRETANRASAMLLTRKISRASKLSIVSIAAPTRRVVISMIRAIVQDGCRETPVGLDTVTGKLDKQLIKAIATTDRSISRLRTSLEVSLDKLYSCDLSSDVCDNACFKK